MKRVLTLILAAIIPLLIALPVLAIALPDSSPQVIQTDAYKNVLETGDLLILVYENTPYTTPPTVNYSDAFIWRLYDTSGTTELGQTVGYNYNANGYGYNLVSFYFNSANVTALMGAGYWGQPYVIKLSGTPYAFTAPPYYDFPMTASDYSSVTDADAVETVIESRILEIAADLNNKWGLTSAYSLIYSGDTGDVLSLYGQAFFRGAIYGVQAMAPDIFPLSISNVNSTPRTWSTTYQTALASQYTGTYIDDAFNEGKNFFNVDYNLMGLLIMLFVCVGLVIANQYVRGGGSMWNGLMEIVPPLIIGGRLSMLGLGELGLIAALGWLYMSAKVWKLV